MENIKDPYKIADFIYRDLRGELGDAEKAWFNDWKNEHPDNLRLYDTIIDENNIRNKISEYGRSGTGEAWKRLEKQLPTREKIIRRNFKVILRYAAAACIALLIGIYFLIKPFSKNVEEKVAESPIIESGTQKATLTTTNHEKIILGESGESQTFRLENTMVKDTNNTLTYQQSEELPVNGISQIALNTLETPRGGEYTLILSDGTRVFLNAETRLTFPEVFGEEKREVVLDGEAFFEVADSKTRAFIVKTADYEVMVYGTSFNVSAYPSDESSHTTLVQGSVGINTQAGTKIQLIPGEQACYNKTTQSLKTRKVDTHIYTAWKEGKFVFDNEPLEDIMKKMERWYNVDISYQNEEIKQRHFTGSLGRYDDIDEILNIMSMTTQIEFKTEKNKIYVSRKETN